MRKTLAFTLAETLIVIGIIGVVAALTIPTLNSDTNSKDKITKVKKAYSVLEDAMGRAMADLGPVDEWSSLSSAMLTGKVASSMKVTKKCISGTALTTGGCFASDAKPLKTDAVGLQDNAIDTNDPAFVLADGMSVSIKAVGTSCADATGIPEASKVCGIATVDVDGPSKGKSQYGLDLFGFYVTPQGLLPVGLENDTLYAPTANCLAQKTATLRYACTGWVVNVGNMDYNKIDATTGKCSDGTELDWTASSGKAPACPD